MSRLSTYLLRLYLRQSLSLLAVMLGLLFLFQCLKIFDVVVVQGQDIFTLIGQAALSMPPLLAVIATVCMGIGMVRALGALQASQELHVIHANRQLGMLVNSIIVFALGGAVFMLLVSNFIEPWSNRQLRDWSASVAADIVGRTLTPHRFSQVVPGVTMVIGARQGAGDITGFFADDRRDPTMRRTYSANTAKVAMSQSGYVLQLHDGSLQYLSKDGDFSEVAFKTYNIALDNLTTPASQQTALGDEESPQIIASALAAGSWPDPTLTEMLRRMAEGLRAIGMCLVMAGLAAFPSGRRRRGRVPLELVPLFVAYFDKTITANIGGSPFLVQLLGPVLVLVAGSILLGWRLRLLRRPAFRVEAA